MFMTEEAAKQTWCPFTRIGLEGRGVGGATPSYNRLWNRDEEKMKTSKGARCITTDCACWRWESNNLAEINMISGEVERRGYCGLGGRPC